MTKRLESKYKIDRRMGENIWGRPKSPVNRREYGPGQHGPRRKGGDVIEVKEKSKQLPLVIEAQALGERDVPDYIELDGAKLSARFARIPALSDVPYAVRMEPHLVVEYYS